MTHKEHRERHVLLHKSLDELLADWLTHDSAASIDRPLIELMKWSHGQTEKPTEAGESK